MWVEVIITYAITMNCTASGFCSPTPRHIPIKAEVLRTVETMQECSDFARKDTMNAVQGKPIEGYEPGPVLTSHRTYLKPMCYPVTEDGKILR